MRSCARASLVQPRVSRRTLRAEIDSDAGNGTLSIALPYVMNSPSHRTETSA
jgi:hypothetical protein